MRTRLVPLAFLLAAACSPAIPSIDDKDGADGLDAGEAESGESEGSEGEGDPDETDPDPGEDPDEPDEPEESPYAGDWYAWVTVSAEFEGGWGGGGGEDISCDGEMEVTVDEDGWLSGEGTCSLSGWAEASLWFEGQVDDDGEFEGMVVFASDWIGEAEVEVEGDAYGRDSISADGEGEMTIGGWGGDYDVPLFADVKLAR